MKIKQFKSAELYVRSPQEWKDNFNEVVEFINTALNFQFMIKTYNNDVSVFKNNYEQLEQYEYFTNGRGLDGKENKFTYMFFSNNVIDNEKIQTTKYDYDKNKTYKEKYSELLDIINIDKEDYDEEVEIQF